MTIAVNLPIPRRALAIGAHADDIEFGCGATLAKWAAAGTHVTLCVCTDGSKGTWDGDADLAALIAKREDEQRDAAAILGAVDVVFLRYVDGELDSTLAPRRRLPRDPSGSPRRRARTRPVAAVPDPSRPLPRGVARHLGIVAARDPHFFPEQGVAPHRPSTLLCFEPGRVDHVENVDGYVDRKIEALLAHRSQWRSTMAIDERPDDERAAFAEKVHAETRAAALRAGLRAAESFARIDNL